MGHIYWPGRTVFDTGRHHQSDSGAFRGVSASFKSSDYTSDGCELVMFRIGPDDVHADLFISSIRSL